MSRKATAKTAAMEQFFGKMKNEMFYGHESGFSTLEDLKIAMEEYIEYYNTKHITAKLKGLTPYAYREQALSLNEFKCLKFGVHDIFSLIDSDRQKQSLKLLIA